jgi:hypothetical protein
MIDRLAARYRRFAEAEARGHSPLYEALALGVAEDTDVLRFVAGLPPAKQQPNLLFAAVRWVAGTPRSWDAFREALLSRPDEIRSVIMSRNTQTNEPARCAVLLPVLAQLEGPLALLEVGASAGLCLLPDRYGYDYGGQRLGTGEPIFPCRCDNRVPTAMPHIVWRAGLDLNPIDPRDPDQAAWLQTLVWPDQPHRLARLQAALAVARNDPTPVHRGDLRTDLQTLAATAPRDATLVVFHTAVLGYLTDAAERNAFAETATKLGGVWISNEVPGVFPDIAAKTAAPRPRGAFLLAVNGEPVAWTDPHGAWVKWLNPSPAIDRGR